MMDKPENPPAFPFEYNQAHPFYEGKTERVPHTGMTLRDYFAGQALASMIGELAPVASTQAGSLQLLARQCFDIADALLAERAKGMG